MKIDRTPEQPSGRPRYDTHGHQSSQGRCDAVGSGSCHCPTIIPQRKVQATLCRAIDGGLRDQSPQRAVLRCGRYAGPASILPTEGGLGQSSSHTPHLSPAEGGDQWRRRGAQCLTDGKQWRWQVQLPGAGGRKAP